MDSLLEAGVLQARPAFVVRKLRRGGSTTATATGTTPLLAARAHHAHTTSREATIGGTTQEVCRFRAIERLLRRAEFEDRRIFVAAPDQLNDPMEEIRPLVYQGEPSLWSRLLERYEDCLGHTRTDISAARNSKKYGILVSLQSWSRIPLRCYAVQMETVT